MAKKSALPDASAGGDRVMTSGHHDETHKPVGALYACMQCGKVTLRLTADAGRSEQTQTHMTSKDVRAVLSKLRQEIEQHRFDSMNSILTPARILGVPPA